MEYTPQIVEHLSVLSRSIIDGEELSKTLDHVYELFHDVLPFDRLGYATIENDGKRVRASWARGNDARLIRVGYSAALQESSLRILAETKKPRIMDDLRKYLEHRPQSKSTQLMVMEGIRSSITQPLFIDNKCAGFLFFSSNEPETFSREHLPLTCEIALKVTLGLLLNPKVDAIEPQMAPLHPVAPRVIEVGVHCLAAGMVLQEAIKSRDSKLLLKSGTILSESNVEHIRQFHRSGQIDAESFRIYNSPSNYQYDSASHATAPA